jgi:haloalkane dehalogenase
MVDRQISAKVGAPDRQIAVFEYPGADPAFVLMHGFPDNAHIYDQLIPQLAGRHVVAFDFLGWGASDKPMPPTYTSESQEGDLTEVITALSLTTPILVGHDASGPVALNWALTHPTQPGGVALLNTFYGATPALRFPEFIQLFSDPTYAALAAAYAQSPAQFGWLLNWQGAQLRQGGRAHEGLEASMQAQFAATPSALPAFMSLTRDLWPTVQRDTERRPVPGADGQLLPRAHSGVGPPSGEGWSLATVGCARRGRPRAVGAREIENNCLEGQATRASCHGVWCLSMA